MAYNGRVYVFQKLLFLYRSLCEGQMEVLESKQKEGDNALCLSRSIQSWL